MNPSARGWLKKLVLLLEQDSEKISILEFYPQLKSSGFVYGTNVSVADRLLQNPDFTQEERCKLNFCKSLFIVYKSHRTHEKKFNETLIEFYKTLGFYKSNFFQEILGTDAESILHKRIQLEDNILIKNFNLFVTNALLFMDVLAFEVFLKTPKKANEYLVDTENSFQTIITEALNSKSKKNRYDESLIKLLESSARHTAKTSQKNRTTEPYNFSETELLYLIDLVCMATWNDHKIDASEQEFLKNFAEKFDVDFSTIEQSISSVDQFYTTYKNDIALLSTKNLATRFYDHSTKVVKKLITRNSKRIYQELKESKELVKLLSQSTIRELNDEEQKKMQEQMMDLLKSIPSLAIFMLPGGALLLPLFIKFIPKLLPSAFDENRINEK